MEIPAGFRIVGSRFSPDAHRLRDFATRNAIPFTWIDLESDEQAETLLRQFGVPPSATPVVIGREGRYLANPTVAQVAQCAGLEGDAAGNARCNVVINPTLLRQGWEEHFGYLKQQGFAVVVGEFGGNLDWPGGAVPLRRRTIGVRGRAAARRVARRDGGGDQRPRAQRCGRDDRRTGGARGVSG